MSPRLTLALAALVAALSAFVWFYEVQGADQRAEAERAEKRIHPGLSAENVRALELRTRDGETVRIERREGWRIVAPLDAPADEVAVDALVSTAVDLVSESVYDDPEPLANYGLEGEPTLRLFTKDGEVGLRVGNQTPLGSNTYVAAAGDPRVFTVASFRANALQKTLSALRDARVLDFDRDAVQDVEVQWPGGGVRLVRDDAGWRLRKPLDTPADGGTVESLLSDLRFLRAADFVDEPDEAARKAVAAAVYQVTLRDGDEKVLATLAVAPPVAGEKRLVRGREGAFFRVEEGRLDDLPRTVVAFRFKELSSFVVADVDHFELGFEGERESVAIHGRRDEEGGWVTEPEALAPGRAARLLSELSGLEAVDIAADAMGAKELRSLGLAPPHATIRVFGKPAEGEEEAPLLAELRLGRLEPEHGVAAQHDDDPVVYWIDAKLAEHLPISLEAFRNRFRAEAPAAETAEKGTEDAATSPR